MTHLLQHVTRSAALAVATGTGLLAALTAGPAAAAATDTAAPECVRYYQSWRYTDVHNGCGDTVAVTVVYTNGQSAPCRVIPPGGWATFAGYGTDGNYATGLRTCDPVTSSDA
ncbi:alpha-amylase [Streptomyces sp. NPDC012769]|uniref:alpha-amylase n=1 Tax=Streptomyces sp. NPDC012769 TaxID=3364848 RepID=UPI0036B918DF